MKKTNTETINKQRITSPEGPCSLCGQKYNNFVFKGGYICESCLTSFKETEKTDSHTQEKHS